jgi:hypothetical protein
VDTLEFRVFDFLYIDQFPLTPESDFRDFIIEGVDSKINLFMGIGMDLEL